MYSVKHILTVVISVLISGVALSDVPNAQREEVAHLLEFVRNSACSVERNGKRYPGKDAYSHIKKKYDYFRDEIETTEDFIGFSATKSTMSGEFYMVFCKERPPIRTRDWLLQELYEYRNEMRISGGGS